MNSFRLSLSDPVVPVFFPSLSLSLPPGHISRIFSFFLPFPLFSLFPLSLSPSEFPLAKYVPSLPAPRSLPHTSYTVVLLSGPWLQHARFSPPTGELLFIYGGLNEP